MTKITYCMMTQNRLVETIECIKRVLPYVDRVIIVDGGSIDDSIFYLRNWAQEEPKLEFYVHPWKDDFPGQRNNYLSRVENDTWVLVSDPDEFFEDETLKNLRSLVAQAEKSGRDMVGFQCRSKTMRGPNCVWSNLDNYHKRLLFKKFANVRYVGNPHERLEHHPHRIMDTKFVYEHVKQDSVSWHRGARNLFAGGGGPNLGNSNDRWLKLRDMCAQVGVNTWHQFDTYLIKGEVRQDIKDWMITYHDVDGFDGASEHREVYKLYFRVYHPEQEPEHLKGKHIP